MVRIWNVVFGRLVEHVRHRAAGRDRIHRDFLVAAVFGQTADEGVDGALGCRVERMPGDGERRGGVGAHEDDATVRAEVLVRLARDEELSARVDVEDPVELLLRDVAEVAEGDDARVGANNVQPVEDLDGLVEETHYLRYLADVRLDGYGVGAQSFDLFHHSVCRSGGLDVVDDDFGAATAQLDGHGGANATTGARH